MALIRNSRATTAVTLADRLREYDDLLRLVTGGDASDDAADPASPADGKEVA